MIILGNKKVKDSFPPNRVQGLRHFGTLGLGHSFTFRHDASYEPVCHAVAHASY